MSDPVDLDGYLELVVGIDQSDSVRHVARSVILKLLEQLDGEPGQSEEEYRDADEVLLALVAFQMQHHAAGATVPRTAPGSTAQVADAVNDAFRRVILVVT